MEPSNIRIVVDESRFNKFHANAVKEINDYLGEKRGIVFSKKHASYAKGLKEAALKIYASVNHGDISPAKGYQQLISMLFNARDLLIKEDSKSLVDKLTTCLGNEVGLDAKQISMSKSFAKREISTDPLRYFIRNAEFVDVSEKVEKDRPHD